MERRWLELSCITRHAHIRFQFIRCPPARPQCRSCPSAADGSAVQIVPWDLSKTTSAPSTTSYQGGHFHLTINHTPAMLVVNDDHGFAKVPAEDFNPGDAIKLQAWFARRGKDQPERPQRDRLANLSCQLAGFSESACVRGAGVFQRANRCGWAFCISARAAGAGVAVHEGDVRHAARFHRPFDVCAGGCGTDDEGVDWRSWGGR